LASSWATCTVSNPWFLRSFVAYLNFRDCVRWEGRVLWSKLQEAPGDYILAKYLPKGVTLTQFHHIHLQDANALLEHWGLRQAAEEISLQFKNIDKTGQGCRETPGSSNAPNEAGLSNQLAGRSSDAHTSQEQEVGGEVQGDGNGTADAAPVQHGQGDAAEGPSGMSFLLIHGYNRW
jgi:hypothetical protein